MLPLAPTFALHGPDEYAPLNTGFVHHDDVGDYRTNEAIMDGRRTCPVCRP